jgi:hypothetical protein
MRSTQLIRRTALSLCVAMVLSVIAIALSATSAGATTTDSSARATTTVVVRGCSAVAGAKTLGAYYADAKVRVYACGQRPSFDGAKTGGGPVVLPFAGSPIYYRGYQCIELVARYLKARYGVDPGIANGAQAVDHYAAAYPATFVKIANGTKGKAPVKGDVLSLSATKSFNDVGHTGIVNSSTVNAAGNGTIHTVEENWGGSGGATGNHTYTVKSWHVVFAGLPFVKWLRAR